MSRGTIIIKYYREDDVGRFDRLYLAGNTNLRGAFEKFATTRLVLPTSHEEREGERGDRRFVGCKMLNKARHEREVCSFK